MTPALRPGAVFRTTDGGATYSQVAKLTADDAAAGDYFGAPWRSTASTVVVGASSTTAAVGRGLRLPHDRRRRHVRPGGQG